MNKITVIAKNISSDNRFDSIILGTILIAGVLVGIETYESSVSFVNEWSSTLHFFDLIILGIFSAEVIIKILAEGKNPWNYFKNSWNVFDFLIVVICFLPFVFPSTDLGFIAVLRLARILRVFKIVKALPKLRILVGTMLKAIPSMFYVGLLLILMFYLYGVIGVFMFGENDPLNFGSLHIALLSLFSIVTLEGWTSIMYVNIYGCDHGLWGYSIEYGCENPFPRPIISVLYFISFILIGTMVVLNLFIGVIMSAMEEVRLEEEEKLIIPNETNSYNILESVNEHLIKIRQEIDAIKEQRT